MSDDLISRKAAYKAFSDYLKYTKKEENDEEDT